MTNIVRSPVFDQFARLAAATLDETPFAETNPRSGLNYRINSEEDAAVAEVEVPGVLPENVKVRIEGRSLTVETPRGNAFFTLGQRIDADRTVASLKHGLLTIRIPKRDARVVEIKVSEEI